MKPYPQHLRDCVIAALELGVETQADIAERFRVSQSTVEKWWKRWQETNSCAALPMSHGPAPTLAAYEAFLRAEVKQQPDVTLAELCERVAAAHQVVASPSMMSRALQSLHLGRKKRHSMTVSGTRRA
jgi:transposase